MTDIIEQANTLLEGEPTQEQIAEISQALHQRHREIDALAGPVNARIERPRTVADHEKAKGELERLRVESGIVNRLLTDLRRANAQAEAREAFATAEDDKAALIDALTDAEKAHAAYLSALANAQALVGKIEAGRKAVKAPEAGRLHLDAKVFALDDVTARRYASLTGADRSLVHGPALVKRLTKAG